MKSLRRLPPSSLLIGPPPSSGYSFKSIFELELRLELTNLVFISDVSIHMFIDCIYELLEFI